MKFLKKQKKNKSITLRSLSILWLVAYLLNSSFFHIDTSTFTLESLISFETEFTGKYNYEVKNDKPCVINYKTMEQTGKSTYKTIFDNDIAIKNKVTKDNYNDKWASNELTVSTNSDSAAIGVFINCDNEPVYLPNIMEKVISKKDFDVYYLNMIEKNERTLSIKYKVLVVFKDGKIKVLDDKEFADNFITEKDRKVKKVKELIMKNEIAKFFAGNIFRASFKGLKKLDSEKEKLNTIITEYENETSFPSNIKDDEELVKENRYTIFVNSKSNFRSDFNIVLFENGRKLNTMCDGYVLSDEKPEDALEKFSKEKVDENLCSYNLKDMIFSYSDTKPKELIEIAVKRPILYLDDIKLIGANFNEIHDELQYYILSIENVITDKGEIKIVEIPEGWSLIVDTNGIIKSGIYHTPAYYFYEKNRGNLLRNEKIKLYDNEIKDFSLYE